MKTVISFEAAYNDVAKCLTEGGVVVLPTDTVIGIAASPQHSAAVDRLYRLKARPRSKHLPIMAGSQAQIVALGACVSPYAAALLESSWMPGPLTLVMPLKPTGCPAWLAGRTEIAVRLPAEKSLLNVLNQTGPLLVTSANLSGAPTPALSQEAARQLTALPDICVEGSGASDLPSTIVNCPLSDALTDVTIEREGAIDAQLIYDLLEAL